MEPRLKHVKRACVALCFVTGCAQPALNPVAPDPPPRERAAVEAPAEAAPAESSPAVAPGPETTGPWTFDVEGKLMEPECPDDEDAECNVVGTWTVIATNPRGETRVVFRDEREGWFDDVWGALDPIEGLQDTDVQMLNLVVDAGADFSTRELQIYLVRLDPERAQMEMLFEGEGESSNEMDECISFDVIGFRASPDGKSVEVRRSRATEFVDQGMDQECDPQPLKQELVETIVVSPGD